MNIGVIFAGGVGSRMHSKDRPKQFLEVFNKPIIIHTLEHFEYNQDIDAVAIACVEEYIPYLEKLVFKYRIDKVKKIVPGGKTGQLSIYNVLCAAKQIAGDEPSVVLIHDGVRPLINRELLSRNIRCVREHGNSITAGVVKETIVVINDDYGIEQVPSRAHSRVAKAPQCFWLDDILTVHKQALADGVDNSIDSCTLMQQYGYKMTMIDGPQENIKITTPEDFFMMRAILETRENQQIYLPEEEYHPFFEGV